MDGTFEGLTELPAAVAVLAAAPLLEAFVGGPGLDASVGRAMAGGRRRDGGALGLGVGRPGGCTVQLFVWPRGARTAIHDHTSWGVYACLDGALGEDRYERLDDESVLGVAHLRRSWQAIWTPGQRSALGAYAGGIHRVYNAG